MRAPTRRLITLGILFSAAILNVLLVVPVLFLFFSLDLCTDKRLPRTRAYLIICFYLCWESLGVIAAFAVWMFAHPRLPLSGRYFIPCNYGLQRVWVRGFTGVGRWLFSLSPDIQGDYAFGERPFILLARHTSLADTILVSWIVLVQHKIRMRFVMKQELLWDPCLDIVGNRLPNYFVDRASKNTARELEHIAALARGLEPGQGVVMYPEGTRFSEAKRRVALQRLKEKGDQDLLDAAENMRHVLPPKLSGTLAVLDNAPGADVVFFVHAGFEGAASFADFFRGSMIGRAVHVRYWSVPASAIPRDPEERRRWLFREWLRIDEAIGAWQ